MTILSYFAHIFPIYLYRKKYEMYEKHMQLILFVEICSKMSSRMIFWWNKSICTLIWIPSIYTQMSQNPNHYLEPCHIFPKSPILSKCAKTRCQIELKMRYWEYGVRVNIKFVDAKQVVLQYQVVINHLQSKFIH